MVWYILIGLVFVALIVAILMFLFPSKKYMSDIYMELYLEQKKTNKTLNNMSNVFFAKNRKNFKKGDK